MYLFFARKKNPLWVYFDARRNLLAKLGSKLLGNLKSTFDNGRRQWGCRIKTAVSLGRDLRGRCRPLVCAWHRSPCLTIRSNKSFFSLFISSLFLKISTYKPFFLGMGVDREFDLMQAGLHAHAIHSRTCHKVSISSNEKKRGLNIFVFCL